jgi:Zinc carboxypeptidase
MYFFIFFDQFSYPLFYDRYVFTWTGSANRLWRKNRRLNSGGSYGVDLNRNWSVSLSSPAIFASHNFDNFPSIFEQFSHNLHAIHTIFNMLLDDHWGNFSSHTPTSDTYCGTAPFSEPESAAISRFTTENGPFDGALDIHR